MSFLKRQPNPFQEKICTSVNIGIFPLKEFSILKFTFKRKHEIVKEEKKVKCDKCDYTTTHKSHLMKHMTLH